MSDGGAATGKLIRLESRPCRNAGPPGVQDGLGPGLTTLGSQIAGRQVHLCFVAGCVKTRGPQNVAWQRPRIHTS